MIPDVPGPIAGIVNALPLPGRMVIIPLKQVSPIPVPMGPPYLVQFNPESFTIQSSIKHYPEQAAGSNAKEQQQNVETAREFTFEFLIDGTGASGEKREVQAEIKLFQSTVEYKGELHRNSFLLLVWGTFIVTTVLKKLEIKYTMFRSNGTPLRAVLNTTFVEHTVKELEFLKKALQSPDLSTSRMIDSGDKLPLMCHKIYDDSRHYLEVARANRITNFRNIPTGITLDFPPLAKQ